MINWNDLLDCDVEVNGSVGEIVSMTRCPRLPGAGIIGVRWDDGHYSTMPLRDATVLRRQHGEEDQG